VSEKDDIINQNMLHKVIVIIALFNLKTRGSKEIHFKEIEQIKK